MSLSPCDPRMKRRIIRIGCGVYSRAAFIGNFASICGVYSRAAFNRVNTVFRGQEEEMIRY